MQQSPTEPSGGGAACARGPAQPLRSDRPGADRAGGRRGMSPSGVRVIASAGCFAQQRQRNLTVPVFFHARSLKPSRYNLSSRT